MDDTTLHPLRRYRQAQEPPLSQDALADKIGVTKETISRWENGLRFPDREFWPRIREVTGLSAEALSDAANDFLPERPAETGATAV